MASATHYPRNDVESGFPAIWLCSQDILPRPLVLALLLAIARCGVRRSVDSDEGQQREAVLR